MILFRSLSYKPDASKLKENEYEYYIKGFDVLVNQKLLGDSKDRFTRFRFYSYLFLDYYETLNISFEINASGNCGDFTFVLEDTDIPFSTRSKKNNIVSLEDGFNGDKGKVNLKEITIDNITDFKSYEEVKNHFLNNYLEKEIEEIRAYIKKYNIGYEDKKLESLIQNFRLGFESNLNKVKELEYSVDLYFLNENLKSNMKSKNESKSMIKI